MSGLHTRGAFRYFRGSGSGGGCWGVSLGAFLWRRSCSRGGGVWRPQGPWRHSRGAEVREEENEELRKKSESIMSFRR
ncbi:hypothetical protein CesoFtcFv8_021444 [Champsocephalus esox]|uniref:Uncharacterized protein n=1 Tax=Champsocephalus esox TaxID=159716 RepID=A0AAN8BDM3_9TELE|nr:hypothetical protein CesoFtcFv8_021444 [Champsocephalus esox]